MKYKLINKQTGEETLCDKVTIDGFDYYVGDEIQLGANNVWVATKSRVFKFEIHMAVVKSNMPRIIIATNNPNIDIPKVVDEVEELANQKTLPHLRAVYIEAYNKSQETHPFSEEDMIEFADWEASSKEASDFWRKNRINLKMEGSQNKHKELLKELLQIWKEQKPKTLYYE